MWVLNGIVGFCSVSAFTLLGKPSMVILLIDNSEMTGTVMLMLMLFNAVSFLEGKF